MTGQQESEGEHHTYAFGQRRQLSSGHVAKKEGKQKVNYVYTVVELVGVSWLDAIFGWRSALVLADDVRDCGHSYICWF